MYDLLAEQYSKLFPPDENRCDFVIDEIRNSKNANPIVLDAGCATGDLAFELASAGALVTGIDLDADMIDIANQRAIELQKTAPSGSVPSFFCRSMTDLAGLGSFDAVSCFGNTLPHLPNNELVKDFFSQAAKVLSPGGRLIFQLINFSKLESRDSFDFPDIKTENTLFKRSYARRSDGRLDFQISLISLTNGEIQADSTPLLPLTRSELHNLLSETGFGDIKIYKGYDRVSADGSEFASIYSAALEN